MTVYAVIEENKSLWMFEDVRTRNIWLRMFYDGCPITQKKGKELMENHHYSKHPWEEPKIKRRK